eukprot:COSAG06_NODE_7828_length_2362_cov_2.340698_2_plen_195_part_00
MDGNERPFRPRAEEEHWNRAEMDDSDEKRDEIFNAIGEGNEECLGAYLKKGGDPNVRYRGLPALMWAARCGQLRVLEMLLDAGCDIQPMHGNDGNTALHRAAANGHLDVECRHFGGSLPQCHLALLLGNLCLQGSFQMSNGSPDSSGPATRSRTRHDVSLHECGGLNNVQCSLFVTDVYVLVRLRHEFFLKQHR